MKTRYFSKEFNDIKKRLPNQEYISDIEKGPWE